MKFLRIFSELSVFRLAIVAALVTTGYFFMYFDNGEAIEQQITQADGELTGEKTKRTEIERKMKKEEEMRGNLLQLARNLDVVKSKIFTRSSRSLNFYPRKKKPLKSVILRSKNRIQI